MSFSMSFSNVLDIGDSSEIGRYDVPSFGSLFGLGMGMILASFQVCGSWLCCMARLYVCVRRFIAIGPRCLRCCMFMLSDRVE